MAIVANANGTTERNGTVVTTCLPSGQHKTSNSGQWSVGKLNITGAGSGYAVGDALTFSGSSNNAATGEVATVDGAGSITSVRIIKRGSGYASDPTVSITTSGGSSGTITAEIGDTVDHSRDVANNDIAAINTRWDARFDDPTYYSA